MSSNHIIGVSFISRDCKGCLTPWLIMLPLGVRGSWTANFLDWLCTEVERDARFCSPIMGGVSN